MCNKERNVYLACARKEDGDRIGNLISPLGFAPINPWNYQDTPDVFDNDLQLVRSSGLLIAIMPSGGYAYGIICESMYAYLNRIQVLTLTNELYRAPLFMRRISRVFSDETSLLSYLGEKN